MWREFWVGCTVPFLCGSVLSRREKVKGFTLEASPVFICFFNCPKSELWDLFNA